MMNRWATGLLGLALHAALAQANAPDDTCAEQVLYAGHTHAVTAAVFASSGRTLVTSSIQKGPEGNVVLWEAASGKRQGQLEGHANGVYALAASHNGKWLASGGDGLVLVHALEGGQELARFTSCKGRVLALAFSPNDQTLAAAGEDLRLHLLDLSRRVERAASSGHQDLVTSLAYAPDGLKVASGSYDGSIKLWNSASGALEKTLTANGGRIHGVAFAQDGKHLAAACAVGPEQEGERFTESSRAQVALWDLDNPRGHKSLLGANKTFTAVCFSAPSRYWRRRRAKAPCEPGTWTASRRAASAHEAWITSLAYAPGTGCLLTTELGLHRAPVGPPAMEVTGRLCRCRRPTPGTGLRAQVKSPYRRLRRQKHPFLGTGRDEDWSVKYTAAAMPSAPSRLVRTASGWRLPEAKPTMPPRAVR